MSRRRSRAADQRAVPCRAGSRVGFGDQRSRDARDARTKLARGIRLKSAGPQWRIWSAADRITGARETVALEILAFDAYIDNDDRKPSSPNCLLKGDAFRIIDHELAFRITQKLFPRPEPWNTGYLQRLTGPDGHLFGADLRGRNLDFEPIRQAWSSISDERLRTLPPEWAEARAAMDAAVAHLRTVRERFGDCLVELRRALA
jgi:hypothetical protein